MKFLRLSVCMILGWPLLTSCDKGYEVRFTNYYAEPMDSVIIGNNAIVYTNIEREATTGFNKITRGNYGITFVSATRKRFYSSITIPGNGSGKRTIQIDGIQQISILEE